jgi:hypothetical protein
MGTNARWLRRVCFATLIPWCLAGSAFGWGQEGHRVVASIAERHLTPQARAKAQQILNGDASLVAVATWADDVRNIRPETKPWHFIDIPLKVSSIDPQRDCNNGDCVTAAIAHFVSVLKDASATPQAKHEALNFIVHFVGDLHQPLHCEDNNDRGGNQKQVTFFGQQANLHSTWDTLIIQRIDPNLENFADTLDQSISPSDITQWQQGTPNDWALEAHAVAQKVGYFRLPKTGTATLGNKYYQRAFPAVDLQLQKAGIRLAYILNEALQ